MTEQKVIIIHAFSHKKTFGSAVSNTWFYHSRSIMIILLCNFLLVNRTTFRSVIRPERNGETVTVGISDNDMSPDKKRVTF